MRSPETRQFAERFKVRTFVLMAAALIFALAAFAVLFHYTIIRGSELKGESEKIAWREGVLPAARGRILDADGVVLAWTEMHTDLMLHILPEDPARRKDFLEMLKRDFDFVPEETLAMQCVVYDVPMDEQTLKKYHAVTEKWGELVLRTRHERKRVDYPALADVIGSCAENADGVPCGMNGFEKKYDAALAGSAGKFRVMLDRRKKWFPGTLKMMRSPEPGKDVKLDLSLKKLLENAEKER